MHERFGVAAVCAALIAGCSTSPQHQNPFDPLSPPGVQATATLAGKISLEPVTTAPALAGIQVSLVGTGLAASTDATGAYQIANVSPGNYAVQAAQAGWVTETLTGVVVALADGQKTVQVPPLQLRVARGTLSGQVLLPTGAPQLAGTLVQIAPALGGPGGFTTFTDGAGNFVFAGVPAGSWVATASRFGYRPASSSNLAVPVGGAVAASPLSLAYDATASLAGSCIAPGSSSQAASAIAVSGTDFNGAAAAVPGTTTLADGSFSISGLRAGSYVVSCSRPSFIAASAAPVQLAAGQQGSGISLALQRGTGSISGTVTFLSAAFSPGVSFNVTRAQAGALITLSGSELPSGRLVTTTDASGSFSLANIPANVNGQYTVAVAQNHFGPTTAGSDSVLVTVPASSIPVAVAGLSLTVKVATVQANGLFRDYGACAVPTTTTVGACVVSRCAADTFASGVSINLSGTAFTGDAINPNILLTNSSGAAIFTVPAGSYSVSSAPAGRTSDAQFPTGLDAATSCSTLVFQDRIAPTTPVLGTSIRSPTSRASVPLQLVQASTDATVPVSNFKDYQVRVCSPTCASAGGWTAWDGVSPSAPALVNGADNNIFIYAEDFAGNQSGTSSIAVHRESTPPPQPLNVHADNRNGSARITWDPVVSNTSVGISGYLVYYGPIYSSNYADYTGNFVSQGPSPIHTTTPEVTLTGLPNASSFFVTVASTDQVVDPGPNVSQLAFNQPSAVKVNPNVAPLDRAVHLAQSPYNAPSYFNSIAVFGDRAFVSQGSPPATGAPNCGNRGNLPPFSIRTYSYEKYGGTGLVDQSALTPLSSLRARQLVADDNRTLFGFDPGLFNVATINNGIDVIDAANPLLPVLLQSNVFPTFRVQQLAPIRRADVGGAGKSHGVFAYLDTADNNYKIGTFSYGADHLSINTVCDASCGTLLHTNTAPLDMKVVGPWVFVTHQTGNVDGYTIAANFGSIAYNTSAVTNANTFGFNALVVDWPRVYFGATPNSVGGLFESTVTSTAPLTLSAPTQVATLHNPAMKMAVVGDLLLVGEQLAYGATAIEAFNLSNPDAPVLGGTFETDQPSSTELSTLGYVHDMVVSGSNVFTVLGNDRSCYGTANLDVVEMGNPHSVSRLATVFPDNLNGEVGAIRGSRALATVSQGSSFELISADLHAAFAGFGSSSFTKTSFQVPNAFCSETPSTFLSHCAPMAQAGEGVWVFSGTATVANQLALYDASTPAALSGAAPVATVPVVIRGTSTPVSGIAAANGYLVASLESSTDYVAVWDVSNPAAPVGPFLVTTPGANFGRSVRLQGRYAYVATRTGYCVVDVFASPIAEVGCALAPDPSNCAGGGYTLGGLFIATDTNRMYLSVNPPYGACGSNVYAYDLTAPRTPALLPTSFTQLALPTALLRSGPYLFAGQGYSSAFAGVISYDLTQATPPLVGSLQATTRNQYAVGGSMLLIPDSSNGLQLVRTY